MFCKLSRAQSPMVTALSEESDLRNFYVSCITYLVTVTAHVRRYEILRYIRVHTYIYLYMYTRTRIGFIAR